MRMEEWAIVGWTGQARRIAAANRVRHSRLGIDDNAKLFEEISNILSGAPIWVPRKDVEKLRHELISKVYSRG